MNYKNILFNVDDSIAQITINRPDKLNALNSTTIDELSSAIYNIYNNTSIKAALITGAGKKAFAAGADIEELSQLSAIQASELSRKGQKVFTKFAESVKPIIALINGYALGGGCELAMSCHLRIASETATFGQPEVNLGLIPGYGATQRLPRLIGRGLAMELLLTGESVSARRAYELGLVNRITHVDTLVEEGKKVLYKILSNGPVAVKYCIEAMQQGLNCDIKTGLKIESNYFGLIFSTNDMKEGTEAFLKKRKAKFLGK